MQYRYHRNDRQRVRRAACGDAGVRSWCWCGGCGRGGVRRSHVVDACDADHRPRYFDLCGPARRRQGGLRGQAPGAPAGVRQAGPDGPGVHGAGVHRGGGANQRRGRPTARGLLWRLPATAVLRGTCPRHPVCGASGAGGLAGDRAAGHRPTHPHFHHDGDAQRQEGGCRVLGQLCGFGRQHFWRRCRA